MPSSGVNTFEITRDQLIKSALEDVGAIEFGTTVPAALSTAGQLELNKEVQRLQAEGVKLWSREYVKSLNLVVDQQDYTISDADILNIDGINIIEGTGTNKISYPVKLMDVDRFFSEIGQLGSEGRPTMCSVQPILDSGTYKYQLRFWPIPDEAYEYEYLVVRKLDDFTTGADGPAFPSRWYDALQYGLSLRLAPKVGTKGDKLGFFRAQYEEAKAMAKKTEYVDRGRILNGVYSYGRHKR